MNKTSILSMLAGSFLLCSVQAATPTQSNQSSQMPAVSGTDTDTLRNPITLYDSYDNEGINVGLRADLLYMNYTTPVWTFASEAAVTSNTYYGNIYSLKGEAKVGCDLAINYTIPSNPGYTLEFGWYHIIPRWSRSVESSHVVPAHIDTLYTPTPATASGSAHIVINFFDLFLAKNFAFNDTFTFGPYAGVIGGYMHGHDTSTFTATSGNFGYGATVVNFGQEVHYAGIGAKVGAAYGYKFGAGFGLVGNLSYNMLYGVTHAGMKVTDNGTGIRAAGAHYLQHHARPFMDSLLGLCWNTQLLEDSLFLDLHVLWRFQAFENGWLDLEAELNDSIHNIPLYGQGLQTGVTFKF